MHKQRLLLALLLAFSGSALACGDGTDGSSPNGSQRELDKENNGSDTSNISSASTSGDAAAVSPTDKPASSRADDDDVDSDDDTDSDSDSDCDGDTDSDSDSDDNDDADDKDGADDKDEDDDKDDGLDEDLDDSDTDTDSDSDEACTPPTTTTDAGPAPGI